MFQMASKYSEDMVRPMREDLTRAGVEELRTAEQVKQAINQQGTTLVIINSVCGCAAGNARPAVRMALGNTTLPDRITTVFAGVDTEAVSQTRQYIAGYPASSPSIALFRHGELAYMMPRHQIEGRLPEEIAGDLTSAFETYCK